MTQLKLDGCKVAVLAADGFEESELFEPKLALVECGAVPEVVSIRNGEIRGRERGSLGDSCPVDREVFGLDPDEYSALLLPGGAENLKHLRENEHVQKFVKAFVDSGKPIAAICHGPLLLLDAGALKGRKLTSYPELSAEFTHAGANWVDQPVVTDKGIVTSRTPDDIPSFNRKMIEEFAEGKHRRRSLFGLTG